MRGQIVQQAVLLPSYQVREPWVLWRFLDLAKNESIVRSQGRERRYLNKFKEQKRE